MIILCVMLNLINFVTYQTMSSNLMNLTILIIDANSQNNTLQKFEKYLPEISFKICKSIFRVKKLEIKNIRIANDTLMFSGLMNAALKH